MPTYDLEILIRTSKSGTGLQDTEKQVKSFAEKLQGVQKTAMNTAKVLGAVAGGAALAWQTIGRGAELENVERRFDRLSASIGATADGLENQLRAATRGTRSDMELMASAADLMGLGLAKNQDELVRLTRVSGALNMNMNQLVLTLTNQTTARFDQLGVSVDGFKEKVADLEAQGYDTNAAFKEAFLQQAEAQIEKVGDTADTTAGAMQRLTARARNFVDDGLMYIAERSGPALEGLANYFDAVDRAQLDMNAAVAAGIITQEEANTIVALAARGHDQWQQRLRDVRAELTEVSDRQEDAADTATAYYIGMGKVAESERAHALTVRDMNYHQEEAYETTINATDALEEHRKRVAATDEAYDLHRESLRLTAIEQRALATAMGDYFTTAVNDGTDALVSFNRSFTTTGGLTDEQAVNLGELTSAYERTQGNIRSLQGGTAGLGLTEDELNKKLEEQYNALGLIESAMGPLQGITAEVTGVTESLAFNQDAVNSALYAAADAAGANSTALALMKLATGEMSEEQVQAALTSAALNAEILRQGENIANAKDPAAAVAGAMASIQALEQELLANPVQVPIVFEDRQNKASDKIDKDLTPKVDALKGSIINVASEFINMQTTATAELATVAEAVIDPYDRFVEFGDTVGTLKDNLFGLPEDIYIRIHYETTGTPPIGGGRSDGGGGTGAPPTPPGGNAPQSGPMGGMAGAMGGMTNNFYIYGSDPQQTAQEVGVILARQARLNKAARV